MYDGPLEIIPLEKENKKKEMLRRNARISHFFLVIQNKIFEIERAEKPNIGIQNL